MSHPKTGFQKTKVNLQPNYQSPGLLQVYNKKIWQNTNGTLTTKLLYID